MSLLAILAAGLALQAASAPPPTRVTRPEWAKKPTGDQMYSALSRQARADDMAGWAVIRCFVTAKGMLTQCVTIAESSERYEFGKSALRLAPLFRIKPAMRDGAPVDGGDILVPMVFGSAKMGAPKASYAPGRPSFRLTPVAEGKRGATVIPCPTDDSTPKPCQAEEIYWADSPPLEETAPIILRAQLKTGVSTVFCDYTEAGKFERCQIDGEQSPPAAKAVGQTLPKLKDPRTLAGKPTGPCMVALVYDWEALTKAAEAIVAVSAGTTP